MSARDFPYLNSRFRLEIEQISQASFSEVTIPEMSSDPIEYRDGNQSPSVLKIPGLPKYSNLVLKWGLTDTNDLYDWFKAAVLENKYKDERKTISVVLEDEQGNDVTKWTFSKCWPTKYTPSDVKATDNAIAIETLEIVHEGVIKE